MSNKKKTIIDLMAHIHKEEPGWQPTATAAMTTNEDDKPIPLSEDLPVNYRFPVKALGELLDEFVQKLSDCFGSPVAIGAQSVLSAISFAAQPHADVELFGRVHPLSLFLFTIAKSGERKSITDKVAQKCIKDYEEQQHAIYDQDMERYLSLQGDKKNKDIQIDKPKEPILLMAEPTYEGLVRTFDHGQASLALFSDEGGRFVGGHALNQDNKIKTITGLCELWDGSPVSRVRASEGSKKLYGKRLSFHLMLQPQLSEFIVNDSQLLDQGFLGRCLISFPQSNMGTRPFIEENIYETEIYKKYVAKIDFLLRQNKIYKDDKCNALEPPHLTFNDKGIALLKEFYLSVEKELNPKTGIFHDISSFANKALEHACRIAGVLSVFYHPAEMTIEPELLENAIQITKYYLNETQRLFGNPELCLENATHKQNIQHAQELLSWIQEKFKDDEAFTLRYIMRYAHRKYRKRETLQKLLNILNDYGWLEIVENWKKWKLKKVQ